MLTAEIAHKIIELAEAKARELGVPGSIAVVDEGGNLKAFSRMDGSTLVTVDAAQRKANTSLVSGMPTAAWFDMVTGQPAFGTIVGTGMPNMLFLPGGAPLVVDGKVVGAVGFSGGANEQDVAVLEAGLAGA